MNTNQQLLRLHQPGLNRVEIPGIIGDAPACTECGKAWPCPTVDILQRRNELDDLFDYANYRMSQISETYVGTLLSVASVERRYDAELGDHLDIAAWWHPQWRRYVRNRKFSTVSTHIMPLNENARTRQEVNDLMTFLVKILEGVRTGQFPAFYVATGVDRG